MGSVNKQKVTSLSIITSQIVVLDLVTLHIISYHDKARCIFDYHCFCKR